MKLFMFALKAAKPLLDKVDGLIWRRRARTLLMDYTSREEQPLLEMLDELLGRHGFEREPWGDDFRRDIAQWSRFPEPTVKLTVSITLHPAVAPNRWWLNTTAMVFSSWVAERGDAIDNRKGGERYIAAGESVPFEQILNFDPARHHREDHPESTLEGRPETLAGLRTELTEVFDLHIRPVLDASNDPLTLARFLVRAESAPCLTRAGWEQPRYKLVGGPLATALLFDQAGEPAAALACLETGRAGLARLWAQEEPAWTAPRYARIDRGLDYLRAKTVGTAAET